MTQRDPEDENGDADRTPRRQHPGPPVPLLPVNFYGQASASSQAPQRRSSIELARKQAKPVKSAGIDLDANDSLPSSPEIDMGGGQDEIMIEAVDDEAPLPSYQPTTISTNNHGWPDVHSMYLWGHGQLPNILLGKSRNPDFALGSAFRDWRSKGGVVFAKDFVDYSVDLNFNGEPPASNQAAPASSATAPQKPFSYSQAAASRSGQPSKVDAGTAAPKLIAADLALATPHPHAYFNLGTFAWTVIAPLPHHTSHPHGNHMGCPGAPDRAQNGASQPHPAHFYTCIARAVDPKYLLRPSTAVFGHQRTIGDPYCFGGPSLAPLPNPDNADDDCWKLPDSTSQENCWHAYVCVGCRNAFTVSPRDVVPSVLGADLCHRFAFVRRQQAQEAKEEAVRDAIDYVWKVLRNILFRNELSPLPAKGSTFIKRMGEGKNATELFLALGFRLEPTQKDPTAQQLVPPVLSQDGRARLIRAFLEISIWSAHLLSIKPAQSSNQTAANLVRVVYGIQDALTPLIGTEAGNEYIPGPEAFVGQGESYAQPYRALGVTPESDNRCVLMAFRAQSEINQNGRPYYLQALKEIDTLRGGPSELQIEIGLAASNGIIASGEMLQALRQVRLEPRLIHDPISGIDFHAEVPEDQLVDAFNNRRDEIARTQGTESDLKELKDAMQLLRKLHPNSDLLEVVLDSAFDHRPAKPVFTEEEAHTHLSISKETEDATLCMAAQVFLGDAATDTARERIKAAVLAIAEARKSAVLHKFLETGDMPSATPATEVSPVSLDRPAGLHNIGNTCYLNSLLQYFFTIRELREVVLEFERFKDESSAQEDAVPKRVGGREVTRQEIERSKRFVSHLSSLFFQLIHMAEPAVRPELDLAYLALVSTKDEEEATSPKEAPVSTMSTVPADGQTIVAFNTGSTPIDGAGEGLLAAQADNVADTTEGGQQESITSPASAGSPSVLGKRSSEQRDDAEMEVDRSGRGRSEASLEKGKDGEDTVMQSDAPAEAEQVAGVPEATGEEGSKAKSAPDIEMDQVPPLAPPPPPLPPRPAQARKATVSTNSTMMFGKQNDVSEAMDNVIFQIEAALDERKVAEAHPMPDAQIGQGFVQSLFYGASRQTLEFGGQGPEKRIKDETFSYLLVDVASEDRDLYDGLDSSLQCSLVEVDGKQAKRTDILTALPPILQIQLQRVQFDRKTAKIFKSNAHLSFPETLRMGRYLAPPTGDEAATEKHERSSTLRKQVTHAREQLLRLEQLDDDKQSGPEVFRDTAAALQLICTPDDGDSDEEVVKFKTGLLEQLRPREDIFDAIAALESEASSLESSVAEAKKAITDAKAELESLWAQDDENEYELSSVFMHLGAAGYGHYYLYQRALPSQPERWLKFNDSIVADVPMSQVLSKHSDASTNPYWLTYVRKAEVARRIDAVHRQF